MPMPLTPLPAQLGETFTFDEARALGVSRGRLRCDDLEHSFTGVYRRRRPERDARLAQLDPRRAWAQRQRLASEAFATVMPADAFFTGRTAAVLWGLPVPPHRSDDLEVGVLAPGRAIRRRSIRGSQVRSHLVRITSHEGMAIITPGSVWAVLAHRLPLPDRIALGDAILKHTRIPGTERREHAPLGTREELAALSQLTRAGARLLRGGLPRLVTSSASAPESHLRVLLDEWGFPAPALDVDVRSRDGRLLGCSELAYPHLRVALEYEGEHHRVRAEQWNRDIEKYHDYAVNGWVVVRVTATLLYREPGVLRRRIDEALRRGGWDGRIGMRG